MARGKVITTLRDRPAMVAAFESLARARTEGEDQPLLRALARFGPAALPVLLQYLDTPDPWAVRALGRALSQISDRPLVVDALRRAILDRGASDRRRVVGMVLLDQYLEHPLDENLFNALGSPAEVAIQALSRDTPEAERLARLDYLSILHAQQPADIVRALARFREEGSDGALGALAFFALDEREEISLAALEALGTVRRPAAVQALRILEPSVPAVRRPALERMQRKLRFSGIADEPLPPLPAGARVLVSPVDGAGNRLMLFLLPQKTGGDRGVHLFLDEAEGVGGGYEVLYGPGGLPAPSQAGTVRAAPPPWNGVRLLEATWEYARHLLRQALRRRDAQAAALPLEYRFFMDQVWGWLVPPDEAPLTQPAAGADLEAVLSFLSTPYVASWFLDSDSIHRAAARLLASDSAEERAAGRWERASSKLAHSECNEEWCRRYAGRLRDTAEWLTRAREIGWATVAQGAAEELEQRGPRSVFARAILQKSLAIAARSLR
jgi:hypothetical protein